MKASILFLILWILPGIALMAQTRRDKGLRQDTVIKTIPITETKEATPSGEKAVLHRLSPGAKRWSIEGSYGMAFGDQTTINIVPQIRYSQSAYFSMGGGLSYSYYYKSGQIKERWHYLGINLFARLTPFPYIALQIQPELLERWGKSGSEKVPGKLVPVFLAGGGFLIPAGPGSVDLLFLFDIIQDKYTPYGKNLYYTIGYSFRF